MKQIKIIKVEEWNWYKLGDVFTIKDENKYSCIGVQVYKENNGKDPDVIQNDHFEYI